MGGTIVSLDSIKFDPVPSGLVPLDSIKFDDETPKQTVKNLVVGGGDIVPLDSIKFDEGIVDKAINFGKGAAHTVRAIDETVTGIGRGMIAFPVSKLRGLWEIAIKGGDTEAAKAAEEAWAKAISFEPTTDEARGAMQTIDMAIGPIFNSLKQMGEGAFGESAPEWLKYIGGVGGELGGAALLGKAGKVVKGEIGTLGKRPAIETKPIEIVGEKPSIRVNKVEIIPPEGGIVPLESIEFDKVISKITEEPLPESGKGILAEERVATAAVPEAKLPDPYRTLQNEPEGVIRNINTQETAIPLDSAGKEYGILDAQGEAVPGQKPMTKVEAEQFLLRDVVDTPEKVKTVTLSKDTVTDTQTSVPVSDATLPAREQAWTGEDRAGKEVYRQGNKNGRWWSFDRDYAETFGKTGKPVTRKNLPENIKLIDEVDLNNFSLPGETVDQVLDRLGYDGMTRLEGQMTGPDTTSVYLKSPTFLSDSIIPEVKGGATRELPKYAEGSAINLERLDTAEDVKVFLNNRTREIEDKIGKHKVTWDQTRAQAEALGWDVADIEKAWKKKGAFTAAEIDATRQTNLNTIEKLHEAIKDIPYDQTTLTPELRAQVLDAMDLIKVTSQAASEAGRALNIHKRILSKDPSFTDASQMAKILRVIEGKGGKRTDQMILAMRDLDFGDPSQVNRFINDYTRTKWEKLESGAFQLWMEWLLSHPLTHIVNATSNALTLAYTYPERILAAGIEAVRAKATGTERGIYFGETAQDIFSISKGLSDGWARFATAMKKGDTTNKLDHPTSALPENISKFLPTRALSGGDAFFKGFIENAEMNRLAYRQASMEGLKGEAFKERLTGLLSHPTEDMLTQAAKRGEYLTYQKELGEVGKLVLKARNTVPGLKYFIPFVKTPLNIAKFSLERTPLNLPVVAAKALRGELKGAALSEELAKPLMGSLLATTVYQLAQEGYITGGTPKNRAEKDEKLNTGWQPYSVKIDDTYYSFARMEPLGSILGMTADMVQIQKEMKEDETYNVATGIMGSITTNISNKTFMQGFTNLVQAISDPGRYGINIGKQLAGSAVPSVVAGVERSTDPYIRDTKTVLDSVKARVPILAEDVPKKLTIWGDPIERPGTGVERFISPMQISKEKGSPIGREMLRLKLDIGYPSRKIDDVEIDQKVYWNMVESAGKRAKNILDTMVSKPSWDRYPNGVKETIINSIVDSFRTAEREKLRAEYIREGLIDPAKKILEGR
jgi:hypothetical protein